MTKEQLREELECGKTLKELFEFTDGQECLIYNANDFEVSDNIVYIPDVDMNEIDIETVFTTDSEIENVLRHCYIGNDFVEECNGHEDLARELFQFVDWQHPNIQDVLDTYDEDEFEEKFGFLMEELK